MSWESTESVHFSYGNLLVQATFSSADYKNKGEGEEWFEEDALIAKSTLDVGNFSFRTHAITSLSVRQAIINRTLRQGKILYIRQTCS